MSLYIYIIIFSNNCGVYFSVHSSIEFIVFVANVQYYNKDLTLSGINLMKPSFIDGAAILIKIIILTFKFYTYCIIFVIGIKFRNKLNYVAAIKLLNKKKRKF